ncbi:helix-turn-helix domain-containing protein [Nocardia salmonicida]|uniref:helix-turn-helix domain-containing protein n=1 Tax=Nocardia salmonicida TaxID=53431 RepID=UPI00366E690A
MAGTVIGPSLPKNAPTSSAVRPKQPLLRRNPALRDQVVEWLEQEWSPQQIAERLRLEHGDYPHMPVSHETIYRTVFHYPLEAHPEGDEQEAPDRPTDPETQAAQRERVVEVTDR